MNHIARALIYSGLVLVCSSIAAQDSTDLNLYYRYPLAISGDFQTWSPFAAYADDFGVQEASGTVRVPIPSVPLLQPLGRISYVAFDSLDEAEPQKWDHHHLFAGAGVGLLNRLSTSAEMGVEVIGGYSHTTYPNLVEEPVGYGNLIGSVSPRFSLLPSFNFAITVRPSLRYSLALGGIDTFDGFSFSVGIGAEYRFGQDPDAPQAQIRSVRISQPRVDDVFAAMQSYYVDNPVGTVRIENTESFPLEDVQISFFQNGFMDSPTPSARLESLEPGETKTIDLNASYNSEVFSTEGVTPLTGEVVVNYVARGRPAEQRESVTYDLHDKTALTWTDDRKMGSFITPSDSAIRNYASFVRQAGKERVVQTASESLQVAMLAYHALIELGVIYQVDPASPFAQVQENTSVVDSVSLPRDTLTRVAGDCDDLTALYATMLESVGIETAFLTTPGHIYVAVNTGVPAREYLLVHPDRDMLLIVDDTVWVPVEITMLGNGDFMDAWRFGTDEWRKLDDTPERRGFYLTREAQSVYRPVGLRETDLGLQYGSEERIRRGFDDDFTQLTNTIIGHLRGRAEERNNKRAHNQMGIYAARLGRFEEARQAFVRAARYDPTYLDPRINLGSLHFLREDYERAVRAFGDALNALQLAGGEAPPELQTSLYINLSKAHFESGEYESADRYYELAAQVDPQQAVRFAYLAEGGDAGSARASNAAAGPGILFVDETGDR